MSDLTTQGQESTQETQAQAQGTQATKRRKYYKVGETVVLKETKQLAKVVELNIVPKSKDPNGEGTYQVKVEIRNSGLASSGGYALAEQKWVNLWEITKYKNRTNGNGKAQRKRDTVLFAKVKSDAVIPSKRDSDGCYDIYACFEGDEFLIPAGEILLIPTGIASSFSPKYRINCAHERGSTGKLGMAVLSGQIDSGYRGEWFVCMQNTSALDIVISKKHEGVTVDQTKNKLYYSARKAICQAALEFVPNVLVKEISYEELEKIPSERGKGALGSSGK